MNNEDCTWYGCGRGWGGQGLHLLEQRGAGLGLGSVRQQGQGDTLQSAEHLHTTLRLSQARLA